MVEKYSGKYLHLREGYDKGWSFLKDNAELEIYKKDGSLQNGDVIAVVTKIFVVREEVVRTPVLEEQENG